MKLIVPFTDLRPETYRATRDWHDVRYVAIDDDYAYSRLLRQLWRDGDTFLICEHDMNPTAAQLYEMAHCNHGYCAGVYPWTTCVGPALGFTRFSSDFLAAYPDAMEIAARIPSNYGDCGHWKQLDVWLQAAVLRDLYGEQPHIHLPPVEHLNKGQALLEIHSGQPPRMQILGRAYLDPAAVERIAAEVAAER